MKHLLLPLLLASAALAADPPVTGTVQGQPFKLDRAEFKGGVLELRQGLEFFPERSVMIFTFLKGDPAGQKIVFPVADKDAFGAHLHIGARKPGSNVPNTEILMKGYKLELEFGQPKGGKLPGKIKLSAPGERGAELSGTFEAELEKPEK